jgi:hypothetical protein
MRAAAPLLISVIILGAAVRFVGGVPMLHTDLVMAPEGNAANAGAAGSPELTAGSAELATASFYAFLQQGEYEKAWGVALEPEWPGALEATYMKEVTPAPRATGWTTEADFVRRCAADIGWGIKLNGIRIDRLPAPPESPEGRAVSALGADRLYGVHASGHMLGACLIYRWDRDLVVAEIGGAYKVVLPGTKAARASFHQEWFSNLSFVGSLRAAGK